MFDLLTYYVRSAWKQTVSRRFQPYFMTGLDFCLKPASPRSGNIKRVLTIMLV